MAFLLKKFTKSRSPVGAGVYNMNDFNKAPDASKSIFAREVDATPYVSLRDQLSQVWINRWTVLLFLVLVRTLVGMASLNQGIHDAKREALSACTSVESVGSALASMPHYLSAGVNDLTADGVDKAVHALMSMLTLTVTGVEEIVVFWINMLTQTYLCLITLAVSGSLHVVLGVLEDATNFLNQTIGTIGDGIHEGVNDFESSMNDFIGILNKVPRLLGGDEQIPTLNINSSLDALDNLSLPSSLDQDIQTLNNSIPTFAQVQNFTQNAIRLPFEEIKKLINESMGNYTFDRTLFPEPAKEKLTFCSDNDGINDFFKGLIDTEILARKITISVLVVAAVLVCVPMAYREARRYRIMKQRAQLISKNAYDPLDVVYIASRPYTSSFGMWLGNRFRSTQRQTAVRWAVAYATTPQALFVLSLGLAGLFAALCQWIVLKTIEREVPALSQEVGAFADLVVTSLNNASSKWANGTNNVLLDINNNINDDVFSWVRISSNALNDTLNTFVDETINVLNATFGGTVLYDPITEVFNCLIGLKIAGIEKGLTWVSDNAHISLPTLPNNTFSLGAAASLTDTKSDDNFLADPATGAADKVTASLVTLAHRFEDAIRNEAIISGCVIGVWVIVALIGIVRACMMLFGKQNPSNGQNYTLPENPTTVPFPEKTPVISSTAAMPAPQTTQSANQASAAPFATSTAPLPGYKPYAASEQYTNGSQRGIVNPSMTTPNKGSGNTYNGQTYTLDRRPLPSFSVTNPQTTTPTTRNIASTTTSSSTTLPISTIANANTRQTPRSTLPPINTALASSHLAPPAPVAQIQDERVGYAGKRAVGGATQARNVRTSSYADVTVASPVGPGPGQGPGPGLGPKLNGSNGGSGGNDGTLNGKSSLGVDDGRANRGMTFSYLGH